jgi:carboxypeptidase Q
LTWAALLCALAALQVSAADTRPAWLAAYQEPCARILGEALSDTFAWRRLAELGDAFGPRLSGSPALERAIAWAVAEMKKDGLENVRAEPVMVPHWVRGAESAEMTQPVAQRLVMLGLGMSVGTPPQGIEAETLIVRSLDDLDRQGQAARGRIVVFNVPFTNYGETVRYRTGGASKAASYGAVAMLLRSVGPPGFQTPHTGTLVYDEAQPKIPAAAITVEDAERLQRIQDRGTRAVVRLKMEARLLPDAPSANVVGEIRGREKPDEIVVFGGHLDSWDVGTGSTDDGGGAIATWDALRILKTLNLRPRRTLRVVLFTNEENGGRGGQGYLDAHRSELANHVAMLEADSGVFRPLGFGLTANAASMDAVRAAATLLSAIGADRVTDGGGGADIAPSIDAGKAIAPMSLQVDGSKYFLVHHTPADTIDKIDPTDLQRCVAALAVMGYVVADMPERLAR